jgi:hypothetical protein
MEPRPVQITAEKIRDILALVRVDAAAIVATYHEAFDRTKPEWDSEAWVGCHRCIRVLGDGASVRERHEGFWIYCKYLETETRRMVSA